MKAARTRVEKNTRQMQAVCVGCRVVILRRQEDTDLESDGFLDSSGKIMD